jgi:tetratricopeptide (TPR) repeat protein
MKLVAVTMLSLMALTACGPSKNTATSRHYQAFITKYNIYYNGDTHFRETLHDMENKYEDDYSRLLFMHPVEAKSDKLAPQPSGNFDRSIEKAQKAIQLRTIKKRPAKKAGKANDAKYKEWMKRDEYNPFLHNAWMMMGRSQFYNGDFLGAGSTFFYVSKHFTWLPNTVLEAKLWQASSYVSMDWLFEAETILTRIKTDELVTKELKRLYYFAYANLQVKSKLYAEAIPYVIEAIRYSSGVQKTRLYFLLGQLYSRTGDKVAAYNAYKKAGSSSSISYRAKFNARIKQSEVYTGANIEPEVKALRSMTRYDRNKEYLDQIYYAIGNLYLSRGDTAHAIENYVLAAEKSTRSGIDKAISQITLGSIYFAQHDYEKAQPCFSEAVPQLPESYPDYALLKRRSDVLDELAVYSQNVNLQDSLLRLSAMSPEERLAVVNKIIDALKKKEKEEAEQAKREEYLANQAANGSNLQSNSSSPTSFNINSDNSWYFYNTSTRNSGKTEFQRRWGSRKLEDNWRRRNKASFNTDDFDSDSENEGEENSGGEVADSVSESMSDEQKDALKHAEDPHYPEYYLSQIPETDEQKATSHEIIQEGLYNMGVILKDKLEDFPAAQSEFDRLMTDYPDNIYRLDLYYNCYLMYMRMGRPELAEKYRLLILSEFGDSKYGAAMQDPNYIENLRLMDQRQQELYEQTYDNYMNNNNAAVHEAYKTMNESYPLSEIMPKFMFLHALSYVTEKKPEEFNATLREMLERYPDTEMTPYASAWLKGMAQGRKLQTASGGNMRGMLWDLRLSNDSIAGENANGPAEFDLNPDTKQLLVMTFATDEVSTNQLLFELARHNFRSFVVKDFELEQMNFGRLGMIIIRGFDNMEELNHYRRVMAASPDFRLPAGVRPIAISDANFSKLISEGRSFEEYFRYLEEQNYVDAQANIIPTTEIETLKEAEDAEIQYQNEQSEDVDGINNDDEIFDLPVPEIEPTVPEIKPDSESEIVPEQPVVAPEQKTEQKQPTKETTAKQAATKQADVKKAEPKKADTKKVEPKKTTDQPEYSAGSEGDDDPLLQP